MKTEISSASLVSAFFTASITVLFKTSFEQAPFSEKTSVLGITQPVTDHLKFAGLAKIFTSGPQARSARV